MDTNRDSESRDSSPIRRPPGQARTSCDLCKRMKIKCEREGDSCAHCIDRGSKCETTLVERKKRQGRRVESLTEMENRIKRLEAVITASGLDGQLNEVSPLAPAETPSADPSNLSDRLATLLIDEQGSSRFLGSSSGFSLFSPQGLQWVSERTGSNDLLKFISGLLKAGKGESSRGQTDLCYPIPLSEREPLPSKLVADQWIACYFGTFNNMLPLYDREVFDEYYRLQYTETPPQGVSWYASFNVVLAMGSMIWHIHSQCTSKKDRAGASPENFKESQHWKYLRNASSCFLDLMFKDSNLMAVQAICGMAFLLQMNLEPQPAYLLTAAAGRLAYALGLHRNLDQFGLGESEINQRRNVFWIVYIIDKSVALRVGHPSVMNDSDIGVDLPKERSMILHYSDGSRKFDIFRCQVQLALLVSRVYNELYSAVARKKSDYERLRTVGQLDKDLQQWRLSVPVEIRPDELIRCAEEQFPPVFLMHFEYFNCVSTIHRVSIHHSGSWTNKHLDKNGAALHDSQINPRVYASQSICLSAARNSIKLLQYIDIIDRFPIDRFIWTAMYYPLSAFLTLFANTLQNPEDSSASSDLQMMDLVILVLSPMVGQISPFSAGAALQLFQELRNVAKRFVDGKNLKHVTKAKRGYDSDVPKADSPPTAKTYAEELNELPRGDMPLEFVPLFTTPPAQGCNTLQYPQEPIDGFQHETFGLDDQVPVPLDPISFPTLGFDQFMFTENFEWDLANLWNQDFTQSQNIYQLE